MTPSHRPSLRQVLLLLLPFVVAAFFVACGGSSESGEAGGSGAAERTADQQADTAVEADNSTSSSAVAGDEAGTDDRTAADDQGQPEGQEETAEQEETAGQDETAAEAAPVPVRYDGSFADTIQPIFADRCASCHSPGGPGTAHWVLETADDVLEWYDLLPLLLESRTMPPWPAGGDSPAFHEDRSLSPDQLAAVLDWVEDGAPLDVPLDAPIEPTTDVVGLVEPDLLLTAPNPYTGSTDVTDDYRCQIFDPQLPDGGWLTDYEFIPDKTEVVHHAIGYLVPASVRERAEERDGEDGKPGWSCYGSSGLGEDELFIGWAPGQLPTEYPDGTGLWIEPGSFLVIQIHYHYETSAPADRSVLAVNIADADEVAAAGGAPGPIRVSEYIAPAEIPCAVGEIGPLCDRDVAYAAAVDRYGQVGVQADLFLRVCGYTVEDFADMTDGRAWSACDIPVGAVGGAGEIVSVLGHQHEIGDWFKMTLNPGEPDEQVLLHIPDWDFDWQYNYRPVEQIILERDDVVRIECGWDRNRRDPDLEPAYVLWADGTNDEMCFATITTRPPR
ncbi:MAG: hypothetical protein AAGA65_05290 [Actinomycetota bacterium]